MAYYDPTFDVNFAYGDNPVSKYGFTFTRATSATYVNASGLIATAASGELRYTYDPVTLSALGVLIEEQRTNLALASADLSNASYWLSTGLTTVSANGATSPDGAATADGIVADATSTLAHRVAAAQAITVSSATVYTLSVYLKPGNKNYALLSYAGAYPYVGYDLVAGAVTGIGTNTVSASATATLVGGGWCRCTLTVTTSGTSLAPQIYAANASYAGGGAAPAAWSGDASTVNTWVWGVQLEAGAFPTSYIPTADTAATRNADVLSLTGAADVVASWFNKDAGTWLVERYGSPAAIASAVCVDDGAATNRILVRQAASRVPHFIVGSTADVTGSAVVAGSAFKTAAAYAANDVSVSVGGGAVSTDATVTLPAGMTTARIGSSSAGEYANAPISRIRYYNSRIPDDDLLLLSNGVDLSTPLKGGRVRKRLVYIVKQDDDLDSLIESLSQESVRDYL